MGFKRPEVQIFSPRPGRRGRLSVRGDFFYASLFKNPRFDARRPLLPFRAMSASLLHFAAAEYLLIPARLPHSAGALSALTIHETERRPRRFFIRFALQNPHIDARRPLLPFRAMSASLLQLCRYKHTPVPARLPHSAGALRALTIHETEERPRRFFFTLRSPKSPPGRPAVRSSLSAQCPLRSFTLQLRTYAFPRSLTTFRGRACMKSEALPSI